MTIIFNASRRSSLAHPPFIKTPLVGRASALVARIKAPRFVLVHFYATAALIATTLFIIAIHTRRCSRPPATPVAFFIIEVASRSAARAATTTPPPQPFGDLCKAFQVFLQLLFRISPEQSCDQRAQATGGRIITESDTQESRATRRRLENNFALRQDIAAHRAPGDPSIRLERYCLGLPLDA